MIEVYFIHFNQLLSQRNSPYKGARYIKIIRDVKVIEMNKKTTIFQYTGIVCFHIKSGITQKIPNAGKSEPFVIISQNNGELISSKRKILTVLFFFCVPVNKIRKYCNQ